MRAYYSTDNSAYTSEASSTTLSAAPSFASEVTTSSSLIATGNSNQKKVIYDDSNARHWAFTYSGSAIQYAYSADASNWTASSTLAYNTHAFAVSFKNIAGISYVYLAVADNHDILLRRGTLSPTAITWDEAVVVYDGASLTDRYLRPYITLSANNHVWVGAAHYNVDSHLGYAKRSTNIGSGDLSAGQWEAASRLGTFSVAANQVMLTPKSGDDMYALINHGGAVVGFTWDGSTWSENTPSENTYDWFQMGGLNGPLTNVKAATFYKGDLVIGGDRLGSALSGVSFVSKWDGSNWSTLGDGLLGAVSDFAVMGDSLYVSGPSSTLGGVSLGFVGKWDGTSWSAVSTPGMNASVNALAVIGSDLYAGGLFTTAGGVSINRVAKWDGTAWSALGGGFTPSTNSVYDFAVIGSDLYVAGDVTPRIWKWDGSTWSSLGTINNQVLAIAAIGSDLYAGGTFTTAGGVAANYVAKWNGSVWSALGSGLNGNVHSMTVIGSDLYVGGSFTTAGGTSGRNRVAKWDGSSWSALGTGMSGVNPGGLLSTVNTLVVMGSNIYAGGDFTTAGGISANRVAMWNGAAWSTIGSGGVSSVRAMAVLGTDIYVGGAFTTIGGITANRIAKWDGTTWSALGSGVSSTVNALVTMGNDLYVGGAFITVDGVSGINRVAKWNGSTWSALGTGVSGQVNALAVSGSDLYVGGDFSSAGGVSGRNKIARWDGSTWYALGTGLNSIVYAACTIGTDLYVGGAFTQAGGVTGRNRVAKWDGSTWSALGVGVSSNVNALAAIGTDLYVGGEFTTAGGVSGINRVAKWDGSTWSALGDGLTGSSTTANALLAIGTDLYVAGTFNNAGGVNGTNYLAKWDSLESVWSPVGQGIRDQAQALTAFDGKLYVGTASSSVNVYQPVVLSGSPTISVAGDAGKLHIAGASAGKIQYRGYDGTTWSAVTDITAGASRDPQLAIRTSNGYAYMHYVESNALKSRVNNTASWSAATTLYTGTGITNLTCPEFANGPVLPCLWTNSSSGLPYEVLAKTLGL